MADGVIAFASPPDQQQRGLAVDPAGNFLVQAPAGSGKTTLLTERFLRLLAQVEEPEQVLAITFTRAAVAEMRSRIVHALQAASAGTPVANAAEERTRHAALAALANSAARGWQLLSEPRLINVQTIDGLALEIASKTPLTSRLGPGFAPTENAQELHRRAALRTLKKLQHLRSGEPALRQTAEAAATLLRHRDNRLQPCADLLAAMLATRSQWGRHFPLHRGLTDEELDNDLRPQLEELLRNVVDRHLEHVHALLAASAHHDELLEMLRFAAETGTTNIMLCKDIAALPAPAARELATWVAIVDSLLTDTASPRKQRGLNYKHGFPSGSSIMKQRMEQLTHALCQDELLQAALVEIRTLPPAEYSDDEWQVAKALFRLLQDALLELKLLFASSGSVDFVEVELAALAALQAETDTPGEHPSELAFALGAGVQHLLVDEFQDTSLTQQQLLGKLVQSWADEPGRTLFLVGDPMQSIYLFRQAEIRGFHRAADHGLGGVDLQTLRLSVNFRSQPALIAEHNAIFESVFAAQQEIEFARSEHFRGTAEHPAASWHFFRGADRRSTPEDKLLPLQQEAERVTELVQQAIAAGMESIAVLVRVKRHARAILPQLQRAGVGYRAVEMETLNDRQEVLDVFSLTRAVLHPADRVAWLSVVRAPWCGLSLPEMDELFGTDVSVADLPGRAAAMLPAESNARLQHLLRVVHSAAARLGQQRLPAVVWQAWQQLGGPQCVTQDELANVLSYFQMLEKMDSEGLSFRSSTVQAAMEKLFAATDSRSQVRVDVMTIHKAKGREWDMVVVPQMHAPSGRHVAAAMEWMEATEAEGEFYVAPIYGSGGEASRLSRWICARKKQREHNEVRRVLYVAGTRARRQLHLLGAVCVAGEDRLKDPTKGTLLHAAWNFAKPIAEEQLLTTEPGIAELAAVAEGQSVATLHRLPDAWFVSAPAANAADGPPADARHAAASARNHDLRLDERLRGTALHGLLEQIALRRAHLSWPEIEQWLAKAGPMVEAHLVTLGMPEATIGHAAAQVLRLAQNAAASPNGRWVLGPHAFARSEMEITTWQGDNGRQQRLDRVFSAGADALSAGDSHLWIVDYKAAHLASAQMSGKELEAFLAAQSLAYAETLTSYARALPAMLKDPRPVRCALYFPAMDQLHIVADFAAR